VLIDNCVSSTIRYNTGTKYGECGFRWVLRCFVEGTPDLEKVNALLDIRSHAIDDIRAPLKVASKDSQFLFSKSVLDNVKGIGELLHAAKMP
jgi:hypothetical protein